MTSPATNPGGLAALPTPRKHYTVDEFITELAGFGISVGERWVRARIALPETDPDHIARNPAFGRIYIPETELFRLVGIKDATA